MLTLAGWEGMELLTLPPTGGSLDWRGVIVHLEPLELEASLVVPSRPRRTIRKTGEKSRRRLLFKA